MADEGAGGDVGRGHSENILKFCEDIVFPSKLVSLQNVLERFFSYLPTSRCNNNRIVYFFAFCAIFFCVLSKLAGNYLYEVSIT